MSASVFRYKTSFPNASDGAAKLFALRKLNRKLYMTLDAAVPFVIFLGYFLVHNSWLIPHNLAQFMSLGVNLKHALLLVFTTCTWWGIFSAFGLYSYEKVRRHSYETVAVLIACSICSAISLVLWPVVMSHGHSMKSIGAIWLTTVMTALTVRYALRLYENQISHRLREERNVVIVGSGPIALEMYREACRDPRANVLGFVDSYRPGDRLPVRVCSRLMGSLAELEQILMLQVVDEVLIALPIRSCYNQIQETIAVCEKVGVEARYSAEIFKSSVARVSYGTAERSSAIVMKVVHHDTFCRIVKRTIDLAGAVIGLLFLSPVLIGAAIAIATTSEGPVFFVQQRYGLNKRRFSMLKFRTMRADAEQAQAQIEHLNEAAGPIFKIREDPRITPVGKFLRKTSIDELPQLFNVLRGDMSLVGPRPMSTRDVSRFSEAWLMRRFSVKPGITGLWQVSGRSNTSFDRWIELDLKYIDDWSLALDLSILLKTVPAVVRGTGAV
jgi:exopolysaccharide biosynthesis polyprenyl glycosylphosphotransferase